MAEDYERRLREAGEAAKAAARRRNELIVEASEAGMSRRAVAAAIGLSPSAVQKVLAEHREQSS